jgi:uncharacterized protein
MTKPAVFVQAMKGNRAGLLTTLAGLLAIFLIWQASLAAVSHFMPDLLALLGVSDAFSNASQEAQVMMVFLVLGFGPGFLMILVWRKWVERQALATLFSAHPKFRWKLLMGGLIFTLCLGLSLTLLFDPSGSADIAARVTLFNASDWLILLLAYGIGITIQATFEEVLVRGWMLQHCVRIIPNLIASVIVTSSTFALLHFEHAGWATYFVAMVFGLAFGWSVIRLNGLEAAIGAHIGNNLLGALLAGQMIKGNPATLDAGQLILFGLYVLGFLGLVEIWARFVDKPARA